ncbi:MAG TPA: hypothetical protein VGG75_22940 [Trebonia sp.]
MPALDHRLIRLKALPDGFQTEFIETAERGRTGRGEDVEDTRAHHLPDWPETGHAGHRTIVLAQANREHEPIVPLAPDPAKS